MYEPKPVGHLFRAVPLLLLSTVIVSCGGGKPETPVQESAQVDETPQVETPQAEAAPEANIAEDAGEAEEQTPHVQISKLGGGLGDHRSAFDEKYGEGIDQGQYVRYSDDYLHVTFVEGEEFNLADGKAQDILIQFESTSTPSVSQAKAIETAEMFLPKDAVKTGEGEHDETFYRILYTSPSLASTIHEGWFFNSQPGDFTVSLWHEENDPSKVFAVSIYTGSN